MIAESNIIDSGALLSVPSLTAPIYIWADYCELITLISDDFTVSDEEIYKYFHDSSDLRPKDINSLDKDRTIAIIRDALSHMVLRSQILRDKYPFCYDDENFIVSLKDSLGHIEYMYLQLLLSSNLPYMRQQKNSTLTSDFEIISLYVLRKLFPAAKIKLFGSSNRNALSVDDKFISTKLKDKIRELASMICQRCDDDAVNFFKEQNTGDNGVDIVGFIDLKDKRSSHPLLFAQCACSKKDWIEKQNSTSRANWEKYLHISDTSIQNFIFVPFPYITNEKEWVDPYKISRNVMIDRIRIMNVLENDSNVSLIEFQNIQNGWGKQI